MMFYMSAGDKKAAMRRRCTRKRLAAAGSRFEPGVTFCGKGGTVERVTDFL